MKAVFFASLFGTLLSIGAFAKAEDNFPYLPTSFKCQEVDSQGKTIDDGYYVKGDLEKSWGSPVVGTIKLMDPGHNDLEAQSVQYKYDIEKFYLLAKRETNHGLHMITEVQASTIGRKDGSHYRGAVREYPLEDDKQVTTYNALCTFQ